MRPFLTQAFALVVLFAGCFFASTSHAQLVVNIDSAEFDVAAFQANDPNLPASSAGFGLVNIGGYVGARDAGALVSSPITTATGTTTLTASTIGTPSNNGFGANPASYTNNDPILETNLFANDDGVLGVDISGVASLDTGTVVTVTVYGIGDNFGQDATIAATFGDTSESGNTVFNTNPDDRGDATGSMPFVQFDFTSDGSTDVIAVNVTAGPGGQDRSHFSGFSVSVPSGGGGPALCGDVDLNGTVDFDDISPFIEILASGGFQAEADCDESGVVDFDDIAPFITALASQ